MPGKSYKASEATTGACLDDDLLYRYLEKLATAEERRRVEEHLNACKNCYSDFTALAWNIHAPATDAEKAEVSQSRKLTPQEQVRKIFDYVEAEYPPLAQARDTLDEAMKLEAATSVWQKLGQWLPSPQRLPRYAFAVAAFLLSLTGLLVGIPYYQNASSLARVERELQDHYQVYVDLNDFAESAPRLSGSYAHQPIMPMGSGEEEPSYLADSRQRLEKVLSRDAKSVKARQLLAQTFIVQGAYTQADSVLRQIPASSLQEASLLNDQGVLHLAMNNLSAAAQDFEAAIKTDSRFVEARYNLALTKAKMGATAEAITLLDEYIKLETDGGWRDAMMAARDE